jgi:hypothetical protein
MNDRDRCRLGDKLGDLLAQVEKLPCHRPQDRLRVVHQLVRQRHGVEIGNRQRVQSSVPLKAGVVGGLAISVGPRSE